MWLPSDLFVKGGINGMRRVFYEEKHVVIVDVDGFELLFQNAGPVALSQQLPLQVKELLSVTQHTHTQRQ